MVDNYPVRPSPQVIDLHRSEIARVLGFDVPPAEVERVLTALQFQVNREVFGWQVTVPHTRLDIQAGAADLIEDLARIYGYDKLPERMLPLELPEQAGNRSLDLEERVRDLLADRACRKRSPIRSGARKPRPSCPCTTDTTPSSSTGRDAAQSDLSRTRDHAAELASRTAGDRAEESRSRRQRGAFELGCIYLPKPGDKLPDEPRKLAVVLCGRRTSTAWDDPQGERPPQYDFFDVKGVVEVARRGPSSIRRHLPRCDIDALAAPRTQRRTFAAR